LACDGPHALHGDAEIDAAARPLQSKNRRNDLSGWGDL
jgi:hypothetical protein